MTNTEAGKIVTLAETALKFLTSDRRDNGETFYKFSDDAPEWTSDMAREAHGDVFPDDTRYEFIHEALNAIADADGSESAIDDAIREIEADCYTHDLLKWLASRNDRFSYVDDAMNEYGNDSFDGIIGMIMAGQVSEKQETARLIVRYLEDNLDDLAPDEDDDTDETDD